MSQRSSKRARPGFKTKPVRVGADRPWGRYAIYAVVGLLAAGIVVFAALANRNNNSPTITPSGSAVAAVSGAIDYRGTPLSRNHKAGALSYKQSPPVGGEHNQVWQSCSGNVYAAPIANENAVHSLEHGAVWITYRPGLSADEVTALAAKVRGVDYMLMSPYDNLDTPISVQAWGYQLKADSASDARIDAFIQATRITTAPEPGATCSGGTTATGTTPHDK